jgi:hypothetical protein
VCALRSLQIMNVFSLQIMNVFSLQIMNVCTLHSLQIMNVFSLQIMNVFSLQIMNVCALHSLQIMNVFSLQTMNVYTLHVHVALPTDHERVLSCVGAERDGPGGGSHPSQVLRGRRVRGPNRRQCHGTPCCTPCHR